MNPILLYPQTAEQVKFFQEGAEKQGVGMMSISEKIWERIDEIIFAEELVERRKNHVPISNEQLDSTFKRLMGEE
jgi:hypothetical protein